MGVLVVALMPAFSLSTQVFSKNILLFEQIRVFGHNVHLGDGDGAVDVDGWFGGGALMPAFSLSTQAY